MEAWFCRFELFEGARWTWLKPGLVKEVGEPRLPGLGAERRPGFLVIESATHIVVEAP